VSDNGLSGFTRQSCIFSQVVNLTETFGMARPDRG
jgi:hypothetical protein